MTSVAPADHPKSMLAVRWSGLSLAQQYVLASFPVFLAFTVSIGWWVTRSIEHAAIDDAAVNAAIYVQSFVAPELQGLAQRSYLTDDEMQSLERLLLDTPLGQRIISFKVWKDGGKVVYYSRHKFIGRTFEPTGNLKRAWQGEVRGEYNDVEDDEEDVEEARLGIPLLETYSPVRERGSDRIIAVAEFYQDARELQAQLGASRLQSWLVVLVGAIATYAVLFGIVQAGGRTIRRQRELLRQRVEELSNLLAHNEELSRRARGATQRTTELNERFLRRVSADLHDGPAQALGLALLRLDAVDAEVSAAVRGAATRAEESSTGSSEGSLASLPEVRQVLRDAMNEVRQISSGLALPELTSPDLTNTLESVVARHRSRTGTEVEFSGDNLDGGPRATMPVRLTVYRLVQESLMNAFRHACGREQKVHAAVEGETLVIVVSDAGPGFDYEAARKDSTHLGLHGSRERVESLGGRFEVVSAPGRGTTVTARLPLEISE